MKKRLLILLMMLAAFPLAFSGCSKEDANLISSVLEEASEVLDDDDEASEGVSDLTEDNENTETAENPAPEEAETTIAEYGQYSDPYEVAEYIYTYGHLPSNYITKSEAEALGWESSKGNLWEVAEGMSIGGDRFGNYEKLLPDGNYRECDVNYQGGYRGSERLIYSDDLEIYYTQDHYKSYTQLY